jgi:dTDP-4-amino-4,6-dideoxygalactose transaminase
VAERIPLSYNPIDIEALTDVLKSHEGLHHNQLVTDFEIAIQNLTGSPYVLALNSGTSAIHLGLKALGVGLDDYVFVSTFTFIGSVNPILYLGAQPVFIDSEEETWNMDPVLLEKALTDFANSKKLPKAIIVVHTYGMPAKMDEILRISARFSVPVLEDAAEAIGSLFTGKHAGTLGKAGILSFNHNKMVTTFGGGALLTADVNIYQKAKLFASQASKSEEVYSYEEVGYNYRLGPLNAAYGLLSLSNLDENVRIRRQNLDTYKQLFGSTARCRWQTEGVGRFSNFWLSCVLLDTETEKNFVVAKLAKQLVETRPLWKPMHLQKVFSQFIFFTSGVAEKLQSTGLCLPSSNNLDIKQQLSIIKALKG